MLDLEKIKNSLSYQQVFLKFKEKLKKEDLFNSRWAERIATAISLKTDEELGALYDSYLRHSKKRAGILNSQNIDGETSLNYHILNAFEKAGKPTEEEKYYGMFTAVVYLFHGFSAELILGQGSFIKIMKIPDTTPEQFLKQEMSGFDFSYEFLDDNTHIIQIPQCTFDSDDFIDFRAELREIFYKYYPSQSLLFVSENSLNKI